MPEENNNTTPKYHKIGNKELFRISKWVVSFLLDIDPVATIVFTITNIFANLRNLAYTYIIARAIDELVKVIQQPDAHISMLYPYLIIMFVFEIVFMIIGFIRSYSRNSLRNKNQVYAKRKFYLKLQYLGIQTLEHPEINNKIDRASRRLYSLYEYLSEIVRFISVSISTLTVAALIINFFPTLIPLIILISIPYLLLDRKFRSQIYKHFFDNTEKRRRAGNSAAHLQSSETLKEITILGSEKYLDKKYINFNNWFIKERLKINKNWFISDYIIDTMKTIVVFFSYIKIFQRYFDKTISVGNVVFWMRIISTFQQNISDIISYYNDLSEFALEIKEAYELFNYKKTFEDGDQKLPVLEKGPGIAIKDLSFKYPNTNKYVLKDININIKPGEKVAIVGPNGAGKTTLIKLLCRIYAPTKGEIHINDYDLQDIKIKSYYQNVGILFQEFNRYPELTAKENILISRPNEKPDEIGIRNAASAADSLEYIKSLPNGFDTILSEKYEGGVRPSTGQWQKIAIARFFYRNAPFVMFDEPTASIDAQSEYNIFGKIYDFFENKTVIIISHRFSTVRNADRIIVIDEGKIIEEGTHTHLMSINGKYANDFKLQAEGYTN